MDNDMSEARARIEQVRARRGETEQSPQQEPNASEEPRGRAQEEDNEMAEARARIEEVRARRGESEESPQQEEEGSQEREEQESSSAPTPYSRPLEVIRNNPVPVAIIGGVLVLVLLGRLLGKSKSSTK